MFIKAARSEGKGQAQTPSGKGAEVAVLSFPETADATFPSFLDNPIHDLTASQPNSRFPGTLLQPPTTLGFPSTTVHPFPCAAKSPHELFLPEPISIPSTAQSQNVRLNTRVRRPAAGVLQGRYTIHQSMHKTYVLPLPSTER